MAMIKCKECGRDISDQAKACPHCGAPLAGSDTGRSKKTRPWAYWALGVLAIMAIAGAVLERNEDNSAEQAQRAALEAQEAQLQEQAMHEKKAYAYAESGTTWVVDDAYDGGNSVKWDIKNWEFDRIKNEYKILLHLTWGGTVTGRLYEAEGLLRVEQNQNEWSWAPSWHSASLEQYLADRSEFRKNVAVGAIVTGAIGAFLNSGNTEE